MCMKSVHDGNKAVLVSQYGLCNGTVLCLPSFPQPVNWVFSLSRRYQGSRPSDCGTWRMVRTYLGQFRGAAPYLLYTCHYGGTRGRSGCPLSILKNVDIASQISSDVILTFCDRTCLVSKKHPRNYVIVTLHM